MRFLYPMRTAPLIVGLLAVFGAGFFAQQPGRPANGDVQKKVVEHINSSVPRPGVAERTAEPIGGESGRQETVSEEEAAILPYYNNYLKEYHLGPEDIISVEVFGQPNYSKNNIVIPPTSRISYPLIPGGVFVGGKTVDEIAVDIKKRLDEYIIDPQVMVTLEKVGSARYSVLGKVESPGVKAMGRRYNLYEAIAEAGGISKDGDKKRILLVRHHPQAGFTQTIVDMEKVLKGQQEIPYLVPGDQIVVPEKRWSLAKILSTVSKASALRVLFGVPF